MAWQKTAAERRRDREVYEDREYIRNRPIVLRNANGRCTQCGQRAKLQCDHVIPVTQGGTHALTNLRALCELCHSAKTATEGGGWRNKQKSDPQPQPTTSW